jgi:hypothetical protein
VGSQRGHLHTHQAGCDTATCWFSLTQQQATTNWQRKARNWLWPTPTKWPLDGLSRGVALLQRDCPGDGMQGQRIVAKINVSRIQMHIRATVRVNTIKLQIPLVNPVLKTLSLRGVSLNAHYRVLLPGAFVLSE